MIGTPTGQGAPTAASSGPCGPARTASDSRCAEAERLRSVAATHQLQLREARLQLADATRQRESQAQARDRRAVAEAKESARLRYRRAVASATDDTQLQAAAAEWLSEIHRLNRGLLSAERTADLVARDTVELESFAARAEAAYDAARVAADLAGSACLEARQVLATCEEEVQRRASGPSTVANSGRQSAFRSPDVLIPISVSPLARLLQGDRAAVLGIALQLEEGTGVEAGRLQLLLVELREIAISRAIEQHAVAFPDSHPFWAQLGGEGSRRVVEALAGMGHRFDGVHGWLDNRVPHPRDLALALSHAGFDPRSVRRSPGQEEINDLWRGTRVLVKEYLLASAPDLNLAQVAAALGPRASRLGELWDIWGRLRPLLAPA